jgi:hypothetical protein
MLILIQLLLLLVIPIKSFQTSLSTYSIRNPVENHLKAMESPMISKSCLVTYPKGHKRFRFSLSVKDKDEDQNTVTFDDTKVSVAPLIPTIWDNRPMVQQLEEKCNWLNPIPYSTLTIGVPKEQMIGEKRVALTPDAASLLMKEGFHVNIESGAGEEAQFPDALYEERGAKIVTAIKTWKSDIVIKIIPPTLLEGKLLENRTLLSFVQPSVNKDLMLQLQGQQATVFAMDCIPRYE